MYNWKPVNYHARMTVTVPQGEYDGLRTERFEIKDIDDWTKEDESRKDVISPLQVVRMEMEGRGCDPGWYTRLVDDNEKDDRGHSLIWMSDTTAEKDDHLDVVAKIHFTGAERILVNGLGLGMVVQAALSFEHVKHVDVVETDERVIKLIGPHYTADPRVTIHHADAYEQMRAWPRGTKWDVGWSDIWPTISVDNLPLMRSLNRSYGQRCAWHGCWAEDVTLRMRKEDRSIDAWLASFSK